MYAKLYYNCEKHVWTDWFAIEFSPAIYTLECFDALTWAAPNAWAWPVYKLGGLVWCILVLVVKDIIFDIGVLLVLNMLWNLVLAIIIRFLFAFFLGPVMDVLIRTLLWLVVLIVKDIFFDGIVGILRIVVAILAAIVGLDGDTGFLTIEANAVWSWWD